MYMAPELYTAYLLRIPAAGDKELMSTKADMQVVVLVVVVVAAALVVVAEVLVLAAAAVMVVVVVGWGGVVVVVVLAPAGLVALGAATRVAATAAGVATPAVAGGLWRCGRGC
jgi:hypothetical protein